MDVRIDSNSAAGEIRGLMTPEKLIETTGVTARRDRYTIVSSRRGDVSVTITKLRRSDSGRYHCGLGHSLLTSEVIVVDAPTPPATTASLGLSSGSSTALPETTRCTDAVTLKLYVAVSLVIVTVLLSVAVLIVCRKRLCKLKCEGTADGHRHTGLETRGSSRDTNMESTADENHRPISKHEDSTYMKLLDRNAGFVRTNIEKESSRYPCNYDVNRSKFFLCRDDCKKEEDVLIETDQKKAQSGRYGIEYVDGSIFGLYATITQVKTSDTGRYKCGYGRASSPDSSRTFSVFVTEAPVTLKPTKTLRPSSLSLVSSQYTSMSYVAVSLVIVTVLLSVAVLIVCRKRLCKPKCLETRGSSRDTNMESPVYENFRPIWKHEDSTYMSLHPASRDLDQTYTTLTHTQHK
ncbi:hypothetical protein Q5P01_007110 [Channa striata]|uniref:Immunoglobulin V-set domain-containing protein n=1 Tax=Channa striata TaxID=64152 RepID=A0AA88N7J9_CHASR|nr:hypothetical protein Q5P01_007110 [Channa striata]